MGSLFHRLKIPLLWSKRVICHEPDCCTHLCCSGVSEGESGNCAGFCFAGKSSQINEFGVPRDLHNLYPWLAVQSVLQSQEINCGFYKNIIIKNWLVLNVGSRNVYEVQVWWIVLLTENYKKPGETYDDKKYFFKVVTLSIFILSQMLLAFLLCIFYWLGCDPLGEDRNICITVKKYCHIQNQNVFFNQT